MGDLSWDHGRREAPSGTHEFPKRTFESWRLPDPAREARAAQRRGCGRAWRGRQPCCAELCSPNHTSPQITSPSSLKPLTPGYCHMTPGDNQAISKRDAQGRTFAPRTRVARAPASPQPGGAGRASASEPEVLRSRTRARRPFPGRGARGCGRRGPRSQGVPGAAARPRSSPGSPPLPVSRARQNGGKVRHKRQALQDMARPLKQWLYKHRDNPYPTKTEKILLALGSQMTLVQVTAAEGGAGRRAARTDLRPAPPARQGWGPARQVPVLRPLPRRTLRGCRKFLGFLSVFSMDSGLSALEGLRGVLLRSPGTVNFES